jgi:pimeloyl-ACP methyl ester carboxylesterase
VETFIGHSSTSAGGAIRADIVVDVSESCDLPSPLKVAGTVFLPPPEMLSEGVTVLYALPGGGYSRGYYDMHFPGHAGYSQAEHHVARGLVVVAIDHLGVGDSSPEVSGHVTVHQIAAANDAAVRKISLLLERGDVVPDYPGIRIARRVGIGQSMGGAVTIIMSGHHQTYDAAAVLGFSGIHTVLPFPSHEESSDVADRIDEDRRSAGSAPTSVAHTASLIPDFMYPFFCSDVPLDIVEADTCGGYPLREHAPVFGSATLPNCAVTLMLPGAVATEAAALRCPVFIGLGDRDTAPDPRLEPSAYSRATDITMFICKQMAHMHNFASTRQDLWDRLVGWCRSLA